MSERNDGISASGREGSAPGIEARLERAREYFQRHHAGIEPDAGFADRLAIRLRRDPTQMLGWAALRLLPASLILVVVLAWFAAHSGAQQTSDSSQSTDDDVLTWLLKG